MNAPTENCDHVKNLVDDNDKPTMGSYTTKKTGKNRYRVVCEFCDKVYGYMPDGWYPGKKQDEAL